MDVFEYLFVISLLFGFFLFFICACFLMEMMEEVLETVWFAPLRLHREQKKREEDEYNAQVEAKIRDRIKRGFPPFYRPYNPSDPLSRLHYALRGECMDVFAYKSIENKTTAWWYKTQRELVFACKGIHIFLHDKSYQQAYGIREHYETRRRFLENVFAVKARHQRVIKNCVKALTKHKVFLAARQKETLGKCLAQIVLKYYVPAVEPPIPEVPPPAADAPKEEETAPAWDFSTCWKPNTPKWDLHLIMERYPKYSEPVFGEYPAHWKTGP